MPQNLPQPQSGARPVAVPVLPTASQTERFVLHMWILIITVALLWALLG